MIRNYFKIAIRNFRKHTAYSLINIIGLTIGLTSCLIISQYVSFEYSFDGFHKNKEDIFRINRMIGRPGEESAGSPETGWGLAPMVKDAVPEIKEITRLHPEYSPAVVSNPLKPGYVFEEADIFYADPSFLKMFTFPIAYGSTQNGLQPGTMMISESTAKKYFGNQNAIGQVLNVTGQIEKSFKVTGIFNEVAANSHLKFNILLPMSDLLKSETYVNEGGWSWNNFITYVQLYPDADVNTVNKKMSDVFLSKLGEELSKQGMKGGIKLQPLMDIHLNDKIEGPKTVMGSYQTVYFFSIIGIITLIIALINYINLSTARSVDRSREVGVRKVVGAQRKQLILQFLCESALTNFIAAALAIMAVELFSPVISNIVQTEFAGIMQMSTGLWGGFFLILAVCTLLAGLYPAFLLSSFKPVSVLKGKTGSFKTQLWLRRGLVILQFSASVVLIGGTLIVYEQLNYMREIDLGINLNKILTVTAPRVLPEGVEETHAAALFTKELLKMPAVKKVATSWSLPGQGFNWNGASIRKASDDPASAISGVITYADTSFFNLYGLELTAGNSFSDIYTPDDTISWPVLANETAVRSLGFKSASTALGQPLNIGGYNAYIAGVLKDFNWTSAHIARQNIFFGYTNAGGHVSILLNTSGLSETIGSIESLYEKLFPGNVFTYAFAEEKFDEQYKKDQLFANLFTLFAGLVILIACLGLFGLAAFTTRQRTKEIGVRKVLGASVSEIVVLLSKDFLILIISAIIIASPAVYFLMSGWLEDFAYRISIGLWVFLFTGIIVIVIALITVSYQSIRAARVNPVNSLKYE